ncbi:alpha/beta hydrolase [Nocardia tengchongensis]|uniref:alpha/beta hydrolase n=2 Tax=Nocardia tengchongensis TaxID=2055889 RepID=UPI003685072C
MPSAATAGWIRGARPRPRAWLTRATFGLAMAVLLPFGVSVAGSGGTAKAALNPAGFDFYVDSAMGPIKSRVFRAADGNTNRVVYLLDGMRAREDLNGWEIETNVAQALIDANINVVMPVGGASSFYADWNQPSTFLGMKAGTAPGDVTGSGATQAFSGGPGKSYTYKWETFITTDLRNALRDRLNFNPNRNGVIGVSMSGSAALMLAAFHPDQFSYASSNSGVPDMSTPGMKPAIRAAMLECGGYNVDAMASTEAKWQHLDPHVFATRLKANNTRLWISAASAIPGGGDIAAVATEEGMGIEAVALASTRMFQARAAVLGIGNAVFDFAPIGIHNWHTWEPELMKQLPDLSSHIG